ncbi:unnamed protein product, partial [Symbiodinium necroappetens]
TARCSASANLVIPLTEPFKLSYAELAGPSETARTKEASETVAGYWICTLSNNQWKVVEELGSGDWTESSFFKALRAPSCRGTARSWCLFEVLQTSIRTMEDSNFLGFRLCTSTGVLNEGGVGTDLCMTIAGKLASLNLRNAQVRVSIREALLSVKTRFLELLVRSPGCVVLSGVPRNLRSRSRSSLQPLCQAAACTTP